MFWSPARTSTLLDFTYRSNPLRGDSRSKFFMLTISPAVEARAIEKLRQEELQEARAVQSLMLPAEVLCAGLATIAHEFQPVDIVGGDFLDDFGIARLIRVCNEYSAASPTELFFSAMHDFTDVIRQHDDMAAVIFHLASYS